MHQKHSSSICIIAVHIFSSIKTQKMCKIVQSYQKRLMFLIITKKRTKSLKKDHLISLRMVQYMMANGKECSEKVMEFKYVNI